MRTKEEDRERKKAEWAIKEKWQKIEYNLKANYGITYADYDKMYQEQLGCCAICKKHSSEFKERLHVDHDHVTGEIRGLLCGNCNHVLGLAYDNIEILISAIEYLRGING